MLFKGNSSKLELLIEKIQANKEGGSEEAGSLANEEVNVGAPGSSWDVGSDGRGGSLSPASSRATPTSAGEVTDVEAQATLGVTSQTPYQCAFCDRAFPRLSYLKRHEQHCCSLSANQTQKDTSASSLSIALNNNVACSPTSENEYKKDAIDTNTKSKVAVVWCKKPAMMVNENNLSQNSLTKVDNPVSCRSKYLECENKVVSNTSNLCTSSIITLPQPLEIKGNEKKLYCYTSAGLMSKPAVFSASLSTSSHTNHIASKVHSGASKGMVGGGMQCIVTSMACSKKKTEGKRKVRDSEVTEALERGVKHKKSLIEKRCYKDSGCRRVEVCFPKKSKDKLNENESTLKCNITSSNFSNENYVDNIKGKLQTQAPIHTIVSLKSDIIKSVPSKVKSCTSLSNQNIKNATQNLPLETTMPNMVVPITSSFDVSKQTAKVIAQKEIIHNLNSECCGTDEKKSCKISPNVCVVPSSYVMNNTLGKSSVKTNEITSVLQVSEEDNLNSNLHPPVPNVSISLVSIKPVSVPVPLPMSVMARTVEVVSANVKNTKTEEMSKNVNTLSQNKGKADKVCNNTEENMVEDDGANGQGNVWVEEKMYSFVEEELRQLGDPVSEDKVLPNGRVLKHHSEDKALKTMNPINKDKPKTKDVSTFTDSSGEVITEDVFSYIENELMRLDAMNDDDLEPLNTSSGDLSSTISINSSVNDSGFCPSGLRTPDSSQRSRKVSVSSVDETWSLLSSKGSMDMQNITASSDNLNNVGLEDFQPRERRSTFSEFNRPCKPIKPRLRRFSISDSHGSLNIEKSPGPEPLLCLKVLDSLKMEKSDHSCREKNTTGENLDLKATNNNELCKVAEEKTPVKKTDPDALELASLEQYIDGRNEVQLFSNNPQNIDSKIQCTPENLIENYISKNVGLGDLRPRERRSTFSEFNRPSKPIKPGLRNEMKLLSNALQNIDSKFQSTPENLNENSICKNVAKTSNDTIQIIKETNNMLSKKRSVTQVDLKDVFDISKKIKNLKQDEAMIDTELSGIENDNEKAKFDAQLQNNITNPSTNTPKTKKDNKSEVTLDLEDKQSSGSLKSILNVQIPLTHVQLSKKHYEVMTLSSPNISNAKTNAVNSEINVLVHDHLSSPILQRIDPFDYQCTPPCGNKFKQRKSPILSPISPAFPENGTLELEARYSWLPIMTHHTPVSTNTTTTNTISTAASNTYAFVTPPSFHSSSSSTVTLEETPSPPVSVRSVSPNSNKSVAYQNMQANCQLIGSNHLLEGLPASSLKDCDKSNNFKRNSLYGEYLNTYLKYLKPKSLNDKVSDISVPSFYLTDNASINTDLHSHKEETVKDACKSQNIQGFLKIPHQKDKPKNLISNLGVFNSKSDEEKYFFTSKDLLNTTIDGRPTKGINPCVDIDQMEFPKPLKDFKYKCSSSENSNEICESNVKCDLVDFQNKQDTKDDLSSRIEEHVEENDIDAKQPSVHIQVRTGALAEQRGKSRAILSKLSQPLIHAGLQRPYKVEPKVILIRTGSSSPDSPTDFEMGKSDCFSDKALDDTHDRKFSAENLLYKSKTLTSQYIENDLKVDSKHSNNLVHPKFEHHCKNNKSNLPINTNLPKELNIEDKKGLGSNKDEINIKEDMCNNIHSTHGNNKKNFKTAHDYINNTNFNLIDINEWKDSDKRGVTTKSSKKNISKESHGKGVSKKFTNEKEVFVENNMETKKENIYLPEKTEDFFEITNMKSLKDGNDSNINKVGHNIIAIKKDLFSSSWKENKKECSKTSLVKRDSLVPGLHHAVCNDETISFKTFREGTPMAEVDAFEISKYPAYIQSCNKASDLKKTNLHKGKLMSKEQSKYIVDDLYESLSKPASYTSSNLDKLNIKCEPLDEYQSTPASDINGLGSINIKSEPFYESESDSTTASFISTNFDCINIKPEPFYESQRTSASFISSNFDTINIKPEPFYESDSTTASYISSNLGSIKIKTEPLMNESDLSLETWEQNVGNFKCVTKVIEGTAMIRAAIKRKKHHAARIKRNNLGKGRRKKVEKRKTSNLSKRSKQKSAMKDTSKGKLISYSRDGEIFDPNNLSTVSGDALMAGITVHCTPEGVTLKLNCVENMENESFKLESSGLKVNRSNRTQSIAKSKENILMSTSKKKPKCKDNYSEIIISSNNFSSHCVKNIDCESLKSENSESKVNKCSRAQGMAKAKDKISGTTPSKKEPKCNDTYHEKAIVSNNDLSDGIKNTEIESLKLESLCLKVNKSIEAQNISKNKENLVEMTMSNKKPICKYDYPEIPIASNNDLSACIENTDTESLSSESSCLKVNKSIETKNIGKSKVNFGKITPSKLMSNIKGDHPDIPDARNNDSSDCFKNIDNKTLKLENSCLKLNKCSEAQSMPKVEDKFILMTQSKNKPKCKDNYPEKSLANTNNLSDGFDNTDSETLKLKKSCLKVNKSNEAQNVGKTKDSSLEMAASKNHPKCKYEYPEITIANNNGLSDCIDNSISECLKSDKPCLKVSKSNNIQSISKFKDSFVLVTPCKEKPKCKDNYPETTIASNNVSHDHSPNLEKSQQFLVSSVTESSKEGLSENVQTIDPYDETINAITEPINPSKSVLDLFEDFESLDSYEETGKAIIESVNPSKSVYELFEDFESLLGSMEDGDPETKSISVCKSGYPVSTSKDHGVDTITLNGSSGFSTFENCSKSSDVCNSSSTTIASIATNTEVNLPAVQIPSDNCNHDTVLSAESQSSNVDKKIDKNIVMSKPQKQLEKYQFDVNTYSNQSSNTEIFMKTKLLHSQALSLKQNNTNLENISIRNKAVEEETCFSNKSITLSNGMNFASNEIQINYKMPHTIKKGTFSLSNTKHHANISHDYIGKKSKRKSLFENKACQSNSNANYIYSRNLISPRENNVNFKGKMKPKFGNQIDFDMKNADRSKKFECKKDRNNNEFEHDHNYNSKRFRRKRKHKDLKVDSSKQIYSSFRNSNIKCTKEIVNHSRNTNQRNKQQNIFKDQFFGSSLNDGANVLNKNVTVKEFHKEETASAREIHSRESAAERELHNRESIYTIYQEKNVIAVSKTSILLNKNTKGKSNVPFEPESESLKINTCIDNSSSHLETINTKKFKANKQMKRVESDKKECPATFLESITSEKSSSNCKNGINESPNQPQKTNSLRNNEAYGKSTVSASKALILENDKKFVESKVDSSIGTGENLSKKLDYKMEGNYLASPKHDSSILQSSPDSPHFGLIHKLAQTSANSGYTKIVVKKVRSSTVDRKKSQGLLSSTLKRNIVTQNEEFSGSQLQVKNDLSLGKDFSNGDKNKVFSTKQTPENESSRDVAKLKENVNSVLSKCDSIMDYGKEAPTLNSRVQQTLATGKKLNEKSSDQINNIDKGLTPLENLEAMVDKQKPKAINEYSKFEQKKINVKNLNDGSGFMTAESSSDISVDVINKDINFDNSDINENFSSVHTLPMAEEKIQDGEIDNVRCFSSNVVEHSNEGVHQPKCRASMIGNLQPLDLRLERSEVPFGSEGSSLAGFSYSVDLESGLVNFISTAERPEFTANMRTEVLVEKQIQPINETATPSISPVYTVQTLDTTSATAVNEVPLIMPVYSVCESKAQTNNSQVMQIYSYSAEDFAIGDYNSKSIYANASSISSVISPNISISNTGGHNDGSLVVPVYSLAPSNNINICSTDGLADSSAILETSQTFPVYLLNPFDTSNCTQISTVYTGNILDETINSFPSEPVYGPHIMPIYSVETGSNLGNTTFGIGPLSSTSENENIVNLHNLEVTDLSSQNSTGGNIVVNVEYIENITKTLDQKRLEKKADESDKNEPENFEYLIQKGYTDLNKTITDKEYQTVECIRESINYNYVRSVTEVGNIDTEISNLEYTDNLIDLGNLEYGDIKSEPDDDESSNTDIGSNHGGSEGGVYMDLMQLDSMTHADQLPFRCEFCGRLFKHKRSRDRHVKLHTGDKKYKCCHCEAAFSRSDHLKIHMKTHDTQKPYQCSVCNRGYNTAAALTAHMQNHKAKLTAHALNQLLKDHAQETPDANTLNTLLKDSSQNPADTAAFSQLLKEASSAPSPDGSHPLGHLLRESPSDHHTLNHFLGDPPKEHLNSPRGVERGGVASPVIASPSPGRENCSPASSPVSSIPCLICHVSCRSHTHLQRHMSRHHSEESGDRPASRGGSGISSGVSSTPSTPSPRPPSSSLSSPRLPIPNPFMFLVGGKLSCIYCSRDGFLSLEALQMHIQSQHSSLLNGDSRDMASALNLPSPLGSSLGAGGLNLNNLSPLAPSSSRGVTCELCGARVSGVPALQRHVVTAHTFTDLLARAAEGVFCAQCLLPFSNPGALAEHIKLVHASPVLSAVLNKRPPSPPNEGPTDLSKKTRRCDNISDLPANTLLCSQCNAPFTNFEAFRRHLKTHLEGNDHVGSSLSGSQQLICPECRLPLTSETALEVHMATHLGATTTEYGCQACLKLFQKPDELQKHLMDIHAHHLYRCALCKEMFDSKVSIQVHFAVKHSNECKVHKCTRCSLIFRTQSEFEAHVRSNHLRLPNGDGIGGNALGNVSSSNGMYRCLLCTLSLSSEAELAAHVSTHQRQFQCSLCDDAFHVEFLLDKHMQSAHNSELNGNIPQPENLAKSRRSPLKKELKCDICDGDFSSEIALLGHRKQAHNIKNNSFNNNNTKIAASALSLFCAYCSEACKSRADLEIHMKSHQSSGGRHKCNICDELCPSAALLAQHKLSHIKVLSGNTCAVCREPLTSEHQFTSHQNEHHPAPLPQPCVVCRQTLVTDIEVNVHARFHSVQAAAAQATTIASAILSSTLQPSTVFTTASTMNSTISESNSRNSLSPQMSPRLRCTECNVKLETPEEAEAHAQVHQSQQKQSSSARTYQCIKCQESFASESEIEAHVASHLLHEGSTHECHLCRGTFDTPLRLQCHLIEHTFEGCGSFTCYMCSSVFTTASRLQQHMVEHGLAARPYDCHHCHQKFFFRAELENHALSHPEATDGSCRECLASYPDLPRFHNRSSSGWPPVLATAEGTTAATRISPARPTHQAHQGGETAPSTNGHSNQEASDPLEEEELHP